MELTGPVWDFVRIMGAVLAANLLTVAFVHAALSYSKKEKAGTHKTSGGLDLAVMLMVFGFLFGGLFAAGFFTDGLFG